MPYPGWSPKRIRQFEHIKRSLMERGTPEKKATELAARTVNRDRVRAGEATTTTTTGRRTPRGSA